MPEENYSFTQKVKDEIATNTYESIPRVKALLSAFVHISGELVITSNGQMVLLKTTNGKTARFLYEQFTSLYHIDCHMVYEKRKSFGKLQTVYQLQITEKVDEILSDLQVDLLERKISRDIAYNDDTICGYLAGSFLASGSVNSPSTSNYHLEIVVNDENFAKWFLKLLSKFKGANLSAKVIERRGKFVIYFKKSEQISNFLIVVGAVSSCLEFEDVRVDRDLFNSTNRLTNFDVANMKKSMETGAIQLHEIELIDKELGINNISNEKVRLLCQLRQENETASMSDLAKLMSEKLDINVSRSTISKLFKKIHDLYTRLSYGEK
ncbi:MAG: DNA-binding protein WhiA [Coprobacillus sp.]|nr:DNA-binding protein WhiA [Coprobacillus sp.]